MIAKILNWLTREAGWKTALAVVGGVLLVFAIATGMVWLLFISFFSMAPKAIDDVINEDIEAEKKVKKVEEEAGKKKKALEQKRKREEEKERKEQKEEERKNRVLPQKKSAGELADKILDGIDDVGK